MRVEQQVDHLDWTNASLVFSVYLFLWPHTRTHLEWKLNLLNAAHSSIASGRLVTLVRTLSASSIVNYHRCPIDQSIDRGRYSIVNCLS